MGIRVQERAFQGTQRPAFSLFSSFLTTKDLPPAVEISSQLRSGDNKERYSMAPQQLVTRVKDGKSIKERNQYLSSSFYVLSTMLSA